MTEQQWLKGADPRPILWFLEGKASDRQSRLFVVACCRRIWELVTDRRSRCSVEVAEQFADCLASDVELQQAHRDALHAYMEVYERCKRDIIAAGGDFYLDHNGLQDACAASDAFFDAS